MTPPHFEPQWTVPPPPPGSDRPIRGRKVAAGIGLAMLAHLVSIGLAFLAIYVTSNSGDGTTVGYGLIVGLILQVVTFAACLTFGIVWLVKRDRGIGLGLIIGWAIGVIVLPVVGFGVCVWAFNVSGGIG